jgi:hypothetical protein
VRIVKPHIRREVFAILSEHLRLAARRWTSLVKNSAVTATQKGSSPDESPTQHSREDSLFGLIFDL